MHVPIACDGESADDGHCGICDYVTAVQTFPDVDQETLATFGPREVQKNIFQKHTPQTSAFIGSFSSAPMRVFDPLLRVAISAFDSSFCEEPRRYFTKLQHVSYRGCMLCMQTKALRQCGNRVDGWKKLPPGLKGDRASKSHC
jgi:hypothetical protein